MQLDMLHWQVKWLAKWLHSVWLTPCYHWPHAWPKKPSHAEEHEVADWIKGGWVVFWVKGDWVVVWVKGGWDVGERWKVQRELGRGYGKRALSGSLDDRGSAWISWTGPVAHHEGHFLLGSLEATMAKLGGGVDELELDGLLGLAAGVR